MNDIATHNDRIATIGIDLGKRSFHLIGMDVRGKIIIEWTAAMGQFAIQFGERFPGTTR